jgi:chemotaxis protein CheY-P-specific phosphatase CheC
VTGDEDRLREVTSIAAAHAATALAKLFDCVVMIDPPSCRRVGLRELASVWIPPEQWVAGVFADLSGAARGLIGLVLSRDMVERVLERLYGDDAPMEFDDRARSALCEIGNIAVSAAAGAIGELEGGIVLPGVPRLGYDMASAVLLEALHTELERLPVYVAETDLVDRDHVLRLRFLWIPAA